MLYGHVLPSHFCTTGHGIVPMPQQLNESCFPLTETCEGKEASVARTFYPSWNPTPFVMNSLATAKNQTHRGDARQEETIGARKNGPRLFSLSTCPHTDHPFLWIGRYVPWRWWRLMVFVMLITLVVIQATSIPSICWVLLPKYLKLTNWLNTDISVFKPFQLWLCHFRRHGRYPFGYIIYLFGYIFWLTTGCLCLPKVYVLSFNPNALWSLSNFSGWA